MLADAIEYHLPGAEVRGQRILSEIAPDLMLEAGPNLPFQAPSNLLDNAVRYGGEGGTVAVRSDERGPQIVIEISDIGPGISPAYHEKVVERFFRLSDTATQPGSGLGLSLVKAIALLHRGKLRIIDSASDARICLIFGRPVRER